MNIPTLIEVAVSLILLYLIFSLLATEIQELVATLLQWRAKHLRESIEVFLAGGNEATANNETNPAAPNGEEETSLKSQTLAEIGQARELANHIYNHPLISTLNYQGSRFLRKVIIPHHQRRLGVFGKKTTAPSYINSDLFATTLLVTLRIPEILQELNGESFQNSEIIQRIAQRIRYYYSKTIDEVISEIDESDLSDQIKLDFKKANFVRPIEMIDTENLNRRTLALGIEKTLAQVEKYLNLAQSLPQNFQEKTKLVHQLKLLKQGIHQDIENAISLNSYHVSVRDVLKYYRDIKAGIADLQNPEHPVHQHIQGIIKQPALIESLPNGLLDSLETIYSRTQTTLEDIETDITGFRKDVANWFDRGMERASGVYTRNAKAVGFLIGLGLAFATNFDTLYVSSELWQDSNLRSLLSQEAVQLIEDDPTVQDLLRSEFEVDNLDASFPLGWDANNLASQQEKRENWEVRNIELGWVVQGLGWVISGSAIALGAPFWFDILNRFVRFRNTGSKS